MTRILSMNFWFLKNNNDRLDYIWHWNFPNVPKWAIFKVFKKAISPDFHRLKNILMVDLKSSEKITLTNRELFCRLFFSTNFIKPQKTPILQKKMRFFRKIIFVFKIEFWFFPRGWLRWFFLMISSLPLKYFLVGENPEKLPF